MMSKKKFKYFVLLANMRTGSNLFEENINLYDSFDCHGELFNPSFVGYPNKEGFSGMDVAERDKDPFKLIRKMIAGSDDTIPGFRLFSDHDPRVLDFVLEDENCAKIVLTRNPLDSFVSHAIARKTDQWKLTDLHKRKTAKIDFDIAGFKAYINSLSGFARHIRKALQVNGQAAYNLTFKELTSLDVFNGLSVYLGSDEELEAFKEKIKRQNPETLDEKVNNYQEMVEQVRNINFLETGVPEFHEPERHAAAKNFILGGASPLAYQPISSFGLPVFNRWLESHAQHAHSNVETGLNQKKIFNWLEQMPTRIAFAFLTHPVERAHHAFNRHIFQTGDNGYPWIRRILVDQYNVKLPDEAICETINRGALESIGYDVEDYRLAFKKFLKFLNGNLKGQTRARIDHSWASQTAILGGYTKVLFPDYLLRIETYKAMLADVETQLGLPHVPIEDIVAPDTAFDLAHVYDEEIELLAKKAYNRDYLTFGFKGWRL